MTIFDFSIIFKWDFYKTILCANTCAHYILEGAVVQSCSLSGLVFVFWIEVFCVNSSP